MIKPIIALVAASLCVFPLLASEVVRDVEYGPAPDGSQLLLDATIPDGSGPFPIAILVHGGGWSAGDKSGSDKPGNGADITPWFQPLTDAHFLWFSINYRMAPEHPWPACFEDVQTAIRWVKKHARDYKGDPQRIALVGHSAGGHLVCLAGTLTDQSTRVQAIVGFAPVTDFEDDVARRHGLSTSLQRLFGASGSEISPELRAKLRQTSPISQVRPGLPPFLLLHGDADKTVAYEESLAFQAALRRAGDTCDLISIHGAPHGLLTWTNFARNYPEEMIAWLRTTLAKSELPPVP